MSSTGASHAERIDLRRSRDRADHDRHVVAPAVRIDHVGEQERAPFGLRNAADELQPHQRMQLGVLVDRMVDPHQQATRLQIGEMLLQIEPRTRLLRAARLCGDDPFHGLRCAI